MIGFLAGFLGTALLTSRRTTTKKSTAVKYLASSSDTNVNMYNSSNYHTYTPSDSIINLKKKIEGWDNKAYQDKNDPVTVGWGQTEFYNEKGKVVGRPVKDRVYSTDFLVKSFYNGLNYHYLPLTRRIMKRYGYPVHPRVADAILYIAYNGFSMERQAVMKRNSPCYSRSAFANFLLSKEGIGNNFFTDKDVHFLAGIITARLFLANYVMGRDPNEGVLAITNKFPKLKNGRNDNRAVRSLYFAGKLGLPYFS